MLCDYNLLNNRIILPTINNALNRGFISQDEASVLRLLSVRHQIKSSDLELIMKNKSNSPSYYSRIIAKMLQKDLIISTRERGRVYVLKLKNKHLLSSLILVFKAQGLLHIE